jgi:hypothetical protein
MSDNQKDNQGGSLSGKPKGFEKKNTDRDAVPEKQQTPNEEVPNVGDHGKNGPTVQPTYKPSNENENQNPDKEESLSDIVSQTKAEEAQPEIQEAK